MGKGSSSAPDPDPNIGKAALKQAETGEQWLSFAKDQFAISNERQAELDALTKRVSELQIGLASDQANWSREDRERYDKVFKPLQDEYLKEVEEYGSEDKQTEAAAEARADVQQAAQTAKDANARNAASMGLDPTSGRYQGMERATDMGYALAEAGAANTARQNVRDKALALKADAINLGNGLPAQALSGAGGSVGAGAAATGAMQTANNQYLASTGIMGQGFQGAMSGYAGQANTLNNLYSNQLDAWKAEQQVAATSAAGLGKAIGGIAGFFMSDENVKEDKQEIPDGEALDAINDLPVEEWKYKDGVEDGGRHVGTYAQDFQRVTGKGDGQKIAVVDAIGLTMKAVQDLDSKFERLADAVGIGDAAEQQQRQPAKKPAAKKSPARRQPQAMPEEALGLGAYA
ncbi:tail fiber domain-containing protein (plasmid) [Brucella anthropi]|uniref:tail fiber domain-containing protein n=1 Tax=Brucella anthropi TaxID=529 RepID=UPI003D7DC5AB